MVLFRRSDFCIVAGLVLGSLLLYLAFNVIFKGSPGSYAQIIYNGSLVRTVSLDKPGIFTLEEAPGVILEVSEGAVFFKDSDCPDKLCVRSGALRRAGQEAACLPEKVVVKVLGDRVVDGITK